ncbi:site-2 protease family protein [Streptomyces sp. FH025]|uniref:site-2 protease family protein n=1 Tax=Streptomyces sp. FH025 TaxID=2815937 RepID=UPI0027DCDDFE|nr:site-2 protease family protein [Streptomyces sp. FH025]
MGRIFGIPLRIHWSAPVLVLFFGVGLGGQALPVWVPGRSGTAYGLAGLVGSLLLTASLLLHETAHAVTARRAGIRVDDMTVFALGGVTRMARPPSPRRQATVAGIGPLSSLVLGGLFVASGIGAEDALGWSLPAAVLLWAGWANLLLGVFNLLPAAPLDGGRLLLAAVWWRKGDREQAERVAGRAGQVGGLLLCAVGWVEFLRGDGAGIWLLFIGFFMWSSAQAEVRRAALVTALRGTRVAQAMSFPVPTGPDWLTLDRFLAEPAARTRYPVVVLVDPAGRASGLVDPRRLAAVPPGRRAGLRIRDLATPLPGCLVAAPGDDLVDVLDRATAPPPILVLDDGRPIGIVTVEALDRIARNRRPTTTAE